MASFSHLVLITGERYLAIKHPFAHENQVTEVRIMIASGLAWAAAIALPMEETLMADKPFVTILASCVILFLVLPVTVYLNAAVYKEVRRNEKQIAANQVSLEAKEKILKNRKAFYTITIVFLAILLCYIPVRVCVVIFISFKDIIPGNAGLIAIYILTLLPALNSLFNPLLYVVRIRYFRVAFIHLLSRKTLAQAEQLERKIFGPRKIGVIANVEQGQNMDSQAADVQQGNETEQYTRNCSVNTTARGK